LVISVVVISSSEDDVAAINTALRDAGHAVNCSKVNNPDDLEATLLSKRPELMLLFQSEDTNNLQRAAAIRDKASAHTPIIVVRQEVSEDVIAKAMREGARDVVSLGNIERLKAVSSRELRAHQLEKSLANVVSSANQYKRELRSLKAVTVDAIADVHEGIIVSANKAWTEMFGFADDENLDGYPIMDLCIAANRPALKEGLVACQRDQWHGEKITVNGQRNSGGEFPVEFSLERINHDGEDAVRMLVTPQNTSDARSAPAVLVKRPINHDLATGLFTRQQFFTSATGQLLSPPTGGVRAMACIRPDRFSKALNDVGVIGTEKIIRQLAQLIREVTQTGDVYGRFGGTIIMVMLDRGNMNDVEAWAELLIKNVASTVFEHEGHSTVVTCSIGLCEIKGSAPDATKILLEAEQTCSIARQKGGNQLELNKLSSDAKKLRQDDSEWEPRIRSALTENRMRLEHQPIGSLNNSIEDAYDTLVRMLDEDGNTILPSQFMPVAERTGLSKSIDRWVIGASISFCKANSDSIVFVRLSRDSLLDDSLTSWLYKQIEKSHINTKQMCFEITEDTAVKHLRQTTDLANKLTSLGFHFAVEHFGISSDSSHVINLVPMHYLKIDGSLMQGLNKDSDMQNKIKTLVIEARQKNIHTIAERVEDANTMAILWQLGVSFIQGYYVQSREIVIESVGTQAL
jgi:diguanylate cyclase (GGDEF)-like protein/PAS domain S-box-containing protein